jgi:hypothetical protein
MRILITEQQSKLLTNSNDSVKNMLFKYWDMKGPDTSKIVMNLFTIDYNTEQSVQKWLVEWYGGYDKVLEMLKEYEEKTYRGIAGTYDFKFKVSDFRISGDIEVDDIGLFWFDAEVDGDGEVYIDNGEEVVDNIEDARNNEDFGWEVDNEIKETINETLYKIITKKTGLKVECDFMTSV